MTEKGTQLLDLIRYEATYSPITYDEIASSNIALRSPIALKKHHRDFVRKYISDGLHDAAHLPAIQFSIKKARTIRNIKKYLVRVRRLILKH